MIMNIPYPQAQNIYMQKNAQNKKQVHGTCAILAKDVGSYTLAIIKN